MYLLLKVIKYVKRNKSSFQYQRKTYAVCGFKFWTFKILLIHVNASKIFIFTLWWDQPLTKNKILYIGYVFIILWIPLPSINIHVAVIYDLSLYEQTWKFVAFDWFISIYQGRIQDFLLGGTKFGKGSERVQGRALV